jgi:hypothetical protein
MRGDNQVQILKKLMLTATLLLSLAACGQKKLSDYDLREAVIGPDSTIELTPGSTYNARIMRPTPDGPLYPLNARAAWSLQPPVPGISVDGKSGLITVGKDVPGEATATILANIEDGRRVLRARLHVFTRETKPLVGEWAVDALIACGDGHEMNPDWKLRAPLAREHLRFKADGGYWMGLEMNIAAHTLMYGVYEYDPQAGTILLKPKWPANKAAVSWKFDLLEDGHKFVVKTSAPEDAAGQVCGYVYRQRQPAAFQPHTKY